MSHEIRTPMNAVIGLLELALEDSQAGRCDSQTLKTAHDSAIGLLGLIGDILDISRIESGHMTLQPVATDLAELVRSTLRVFEGNARAKGLHLQSQLPASPLWVLADPLRVKQILSNLLSNAIKFSDRGEVHTSLTTQGADSNLHVVLCVRDTGIGITTIDQRRLFNAFSQADGPRASQGAGLGLVISRTLAELMGGTLNLQSVEGVGTRVAVELQLPACEPPTLTEPGNLADEVVTRPLGILVVDDYPANLMLMEKQLKSLGHNVTLAEHGKAALDLWQDNAFDLVLTDCSMPVMDGHELACSIRQRERDQGRVACCIIGITANAQAEERARCLASGMDDCLFKPVGLQTLKAHLPQVWLEAAPLVAKASGFNLSELRHLTQDDEQLTRHLLEQVGQSTGEDLAALRALGAAPEERAMLAIAHRIKGGAKMLKVRGVVSDCEALEQALSQGLPSQALRLQLETSLEALQRELSEALNAIAMSN